MFCRRGHLHQIMAHVGIGLIPVGRGWFRMPALIIVHGDHRVEVGQGEDIFVEGQDIVFCAFFYRGTVVMKSIWITADWPGSSAVFERHAQEGFLDVGLDNASPFTVTSETLIAAAQLLRERGENRFRRAAISSWLV